MTSTGVPHSKKDRFPDFSVGTPDGRGLKYNTLYYTSNIIAKVIGTWSTPAVHVRWRK
jgi:hypothetical protein